MTATKLWTVNAIKEANRAAGGHWFDPDTMRFFGTRILPTVYQGPGGVFFVTWDKKGFDERDGYGATVREFDPATGGVGSPKADKAGVGALTKKQAVSIAQLLAGAGAAETSEDYKPVSVLEQFVHDLEAHGRKGIKRDDAEQLIYLAKRHHSRMESACNLGNQHDENGDPKRGLKDCREHICLMAQHVGAVSVVFSGDPRGCTVKLVFADGFTNDFGGEGYCVPTEA